jgi:hypothetical protein
MLLSQGPKSSVKDKEVPWACFYRVVRLKMLELGFLLEGQKKYRYLRQSQYRLMSHT